MVLGVFTRRRCNLMGFDGASFQSIMMQQLWFCAILGIDIPLQPGQVEAGRVDMVKGCGLPYHLVREAFAFIEQMAPGEDCPIEQQCSAF